MIGALLGVALQVTITISAPDTLIVDRPATLVMRAEVPGMVRPRIVPPDFAPLSASLSEESLSQHDVDGSATTTVEQRWVVVARRPGSAVLAPFEVQLGRTTSRSRATPIVVRPAPVLQSPTIAAGAPAPSTDDPDGISFHAHIAPDTVYVGQQATYEVGVYLSDAVRYRLRRNPEFVAPELRSMLAYDVAVARAPVTRRELGGQRFEVHVFQRALFPLSAGHYSLPPARLNYSLPLTASFFSREESRQLRSESVSLSVLDPPADGRPADFAGAVGSFAIESRVDGGALRVGAPFTLTIRVRGAGNVSFFPRPALTLPWAQLVAAGERVSIDSSTSNLRGWKEFDWIITPTHDGAVEVPAVRYPYFDPVRKRYDIALADPVPLRVASGTLASLDSVPATPAAMLTLRASLGEPVRRPWSDSRLYWLLLLAAPLPAFILALAPRARQRRPVTPAAHLRRMARVGGAAPGEIRRQFTAALRSRVPGLTRDTLAERTALHRALRRSGVTRETADAVDALLSDLDAAMYARNGSLGSGAARRALDCWRAVDEESRRRAPAPRLSGMVARLALLVALALAGATALWAGRPEAERAFANGVTAWDDAQYAASAMLFLDAAEQEPRAVAAWANAGTAAWVAHDTATAVLAWQRALRLDPLARDVRNRLALTPGFAPQTLAHVPAIPLGASVALVALAWCVTWGAAGAAARRRDRRWRTTAIVAGALTLVLAAFAWRAGESAAARQVAVVSETSSLRALPALGGEAMARALTGEVAEIRRAQGVWSRVRLSDREGWMETDLLRTIALPDAPR
ncbi:MAG TPA: BatD family protein [Gemmatimonadaceae bacterium]|nr:BatD family protein [Gemmatimonadaceae bacterium]